MGSHCFDYTLHIQTFLRIFYFKLKMYDIYILFVVTMMGHFFYFVCGCLAALPFLFQFLSAV